MGGSKQGYTGILHCLRKVSNDEGISALWQGSFTSIILALNPAIQLGVYEALKRNHLILGVIADKIGNGGESLGPFVNSFLAKFIATVVTYPIQVLQTRHRAGIQNDGKATSQKNIIRRLYRGFEAKVLQTCLNSGIMFIAYEWLVGALTNLIIAKDEGS
jgi:adenine nucleotide transporter 17